MSDYGTRYADRAERVLEIRFQRTFTEAQSDILKKLDAFTAKYQKKDKQMRKKLEAGEIDQEKYDRWVAGQVFQGAQWEQKVKDIDDTLLDYYSDALDKTYDKQLDVFSKNANYQAYCMEHDVGKNFGFDLYDVDTVERLVQETPELLPRKIVNKKKHNHWNQGIINNCITQGVIQGESIQKIARRIANTTANHNMKSATMYARTAMTSAQNGGRMEMLKEAKGKGINVKKQWLAIVDNRTRDSHIHLDGQIRDVDKPFKSDYGRIDFPGDFKANPADVYNCRCTLVYVFPEYEDMSQYPDWEEAKTMTYPEWEDAKQEAPEGENPEIDKIRKKINSLERKLDNWNDDAYEDYAVSSNEYTKVQDRIDSLYEEMAKKKYPDDDVMVGIRHIDSRHTAEQDIKATNPNYTKGEEWKRNCQRTVPTYEMRRRGYDVTAKPRILGGQKDAVFDDWKNVFENADWIPCKKGSGIAEATKQMKKWGRGSRAELYVKWKGNNSGAHVYVVENVKGKVIFRDPQNGDTVAIPFTTLVEEGRTEICRIDNLKPSKLILECMTGRK